MSQLWPKTAAHFCAPMQSRLDLRTDRYKQVKFCCSHFVQAVCKPALVKKPQNYSSAASTLIHIAVSARLAIAGFLSDHNTNETTGLILVSAIGWRIYKFKSTLSALLITADRPSRGVPGNHSHHCDQCLFYFYFLFFNLKNLSSALFVLQFLGDPPKQFLQISIT